jgi:transposase
VNFLNLPKWEVTPLQEDDDRYVMLARPLTPCTTCPTCGSVALVKNGTEASQVRDLPAQGKHVLIQVKRQRYCCKDR